jgi:hypothetical protein
MDSADVDPQMLLDKFVKDLEFRMTEHSGVHLHLDWPVLRMLGVPRSDPSAMAVANAMAAGFERCFLEDEGFGDELAQFMRGECTDKDLLKSSANHRGRMTTANFIIGVDYLAGDKRTLARKHFQAAVDTNFFLYYVYRWSLAFLERVDDPKWLPWLRNNSGQEPADL